MEITAESTVKRKLENSDLKKSDVFKLLALKSVAASFSLYLITLTASALN